MRTVEQLMSSVVIAIEPDMNARDALGLAMEHGVSHLPVVLDRRTVGVVCACELDTADAGQNVSALMHSPAVCVRADDSLESAMRLMAEREVGSVLVMAGGELAGIVTRSDVERAGLAREAFGDRSCAECGSYQHVRPDEGSARLTCWACRRVRRGGATR